MPEPPDSAPARPAAGRPMKGQAAAELFDPATEIGRDLLAVDWSATSLGSMSAWPASLRNIVRLLLGSRFSMWMAWGPELTFLCNDAYRRDTLGAKYPWALGRPAAEVWSEIWPDIGPRIESVITTGVATWDESLMLFLERSGYQEETYHTFSYSPVADDDGQVRGMLCVVSEETARVIGAQRMTILRDVGTALATAGTEAEVHAAAAGQLGADGRTLPFVLTYLFDDDRTAARLAWTAGVPTAHPVAPEVLPLRAPDPAWPTDRVAGGRSQIVDDLTDRFPDVPTGDWPEPPTTALLVPLSRPAGRDPYGFLAVALNRYRALDDDYRGFIDLLAGQLSAAITRGRAYEQERRRAQDLAELDRAKTTFFTNVSHELRTPLTLLLGPVDDALGDRAEPLPARHRARLEMVERNAERLLKLVNTLLDFSRMESGEVAARFEPLDLARYTAELASMFESAAARAGLELSVECTPLPERVHVDREMWAKIVLNLVSNAFKATFTGGVTVRFGERDGAAELAVIDTGIGIPESEQQRLFERFHRVSGAALRSHEGSGIGLALVAELAAVHGAAVSVTSAPGAGSTFSVRVPFGTAHLPPDQVGHDNVDEVPDLQRYGAGYLAEATRWFEEKDRQDGAAAPAPPATHRPRVLVVDDNADMRDYVSGLLHDDYQVETARDGIEALEAGRSRPPDLVLTDVMMPRLDGFGLLSALRDDAATMHVPVIMLSARSGDDATVEGLEAGADDYLVKPFSARELLARVRANLELDRVRRVAEELARSRELLDQAERLASVGSWELDLVRGDVRASPEFFRILGMDERTLRAEQGLDDVLRSVHEDDRPGFRAAVDATASSGVPLDAQVRIVRPDGDERLLRAHGVLHRGQDGAATTVRGSVQDITEHRRAELAQASAAATREAAAREHEIAEELQRSLLPALPFQPDRIDVAVYYRAGVEGTQAGGDWYDVIDLEQGRTALVLGDVMGRGVGAAAVMGQLRATIRAYARLGLPPAELLGLLDDMVQTIGSHTIVTCVYAVFDPATSSLTYGNAGHLPPLLCSPGGVTQALVAGDPPLGTGYYAGRVETVVVEPGTLITLYTDGLVEHRDRAIQAGIDQLVAALSAISVPVEGVPSTLVQALLPHEPDDDVAILSAVLGRPDGARPAVSAEVEPAPEGVAAARAVADKACAEWDIDDSAAFDISLIVSELATNAVRHGRPPIELVLRREVDCIVIEVSDGAPGRPTRREAAPSEASGRGLTLIDALASQWGTRPTGRGKAVWCTVATPR